MALIKACRRRLASAAIAVLTALGLQPTLSVAATQPPTTPEIRIAFVGDSMSDGIWGGIVRMVATDACLKGHFDLGRFGNNGTGLTRPDKYDWPEEVKKIVATFKPDLLVVSLGLNDRQFIVDVSAGGRTKVEFDTPEWTTKYTEQVTEFLKNGATTPAGLIWIGIPVMRDPTANLDAIQKNKIYSSAIAEFGNPKVRFIPPWRLNEDGPEVYKSIGPGRDGTIVGLRAPDGVHFTSAGYDVLAAYVYPKIVENLEQNQIAVPKPCGK